MQKSKSTALALAWILGVVGGHRFYMGYTGTAILMAAISILTLGFGAIISGIWAIIDISRIICDEMPDATGAPLATRPIPAKIV